MNIILKRSLAFILSFMIVFSSTSVLAASPAGWTASGVVMNGAIATVTAIKGSGSTALKSVITHAPAAGRVGKEILKGGGVIGVAFALSQILGAGVDWVMDPANNRVKYKDDTVNPELPLEYIYYERTYKKYGTTPALATAHYASNINDRGWSYDSDDCPPLITRGVDCFVLYTAPRGGRAAIPVSIVRNPSYDSNAVPSDNYKYIPISAVADAVIANAEAGDLPSQDAIKAAAIESVAVGELDTELQASAVPVGGSTGGSTGGTVTNPDGSVTNPDGTVTNPDGSVTNPDGTVTDPVIPADPSGVIAAIKALASTLGAKFTSITNAIGITNTKLDDIADANAEAAKDAKDATDAKAVADAEFTDWATAEPEPLDPNTALDIDVPSVLPVDTDINFGGSCPASFEVNSSIFGNPINIVLLDSSKFCGFLSTFVKFPVYAASSLFALYILGGRKDV